MLSWALVAAGGMEEALRRELGTSVLRATGHSGGGCINQGQSYETDGGRVYVKSNSKPEVGGGGFEGGVRVASLWFGAGFCEGGRSLEAGWAGLSRAEPLCEGGGEVGRLASDGSG